MYTNGGLKIVRPLKNHAAIRRVQFSVTGTSVLIKQINSIIEFAAFQSL